MTNHASVQRSKSHSQLSSCGFPLMPRTVTALPLCTAIEMCCRRYLQQWGSPVILQRCCPSSPMNSSAVSPSTPDVSMAKCTKSGLSSVVWTSPFSPLSSVLLFLERSVSSWCRKLSRTSYLVSDTEVIVLQVLIISMSISLNTRAELQARDFQSMAGLSTSVSEDYTSPKVPIMKGLYFPHILMARSSEW